MIPLHCLRLRQLYSYLFYSLEKSVEYLPYLKEYIIDNSVRHFLGEQLSHGKLYKNMVDCVLSHTILKISCKNSI